jgi:hypothetical protein
VSGPQEWLIWRTKTVLGWCAVPFQIALLVGTALLAAAGWGFVKLHLWLFDRWIGDTLEEVFSYRTNGLCWRK